SFRILAEGSAPMFRVNGSSPMLVQPAVNSKIVSKYFEILLVLKLKLIARFTVNSVYRVKDSKIEYLIYWTNNNKTKPIGYFQVNLY
ncbi:uncharacterized protein METZ01_LOCUS101036, partial [marine metagenome]